MRKISDLLERAADLLEEIADAGLGGGAAAPLRGDGPPVSGIGGTEAAAGTRYYDDLFDPPVPYEQMGADAADPQWVAIQTGEQT